MKTATKKGMGFGLTSGVITTLGLIIGLYSSTNSRTAIVGGILIIAIADSLSDAFGMHLSEEYGTKDKERDIWLATFSTLFFKFFAALTFVIPFVFFQLTIATIISIFWGGILISGFSYRVAKNHNHSPKKAIIQHLTITVIVIILTFFVGKTINLIFA